MINFLFQAQYRYELQFAQATLPAAPPPSAPPSYPLNPRDVPVPAGNLGSSLYPVLSDFMGLDLSPQALAELAPEYAVSVSQPVSIWHN